jgi:hypothetical protein
MPNFMLEVDLSDLTGSGDEARARLRVEQALLSYLLRPMIASAGQTREISVPRPEPLGGVQFVGVARYT